uniref:Uncharacterized protein n=1 Tax=Arundo donax TaxID=35708 RepID=A0A0A9CD19_ARUDO
MSALPRCLYEAMPPLSPPSALASQPLGAAPPA